MPNYCTVCGQSKAKDLSLSLYQIPKEPELRKSWLENLGFVEDKIAAESRVCSRHFRDGNPKNVPSLYIGKRFSDRPAEKTPRGKRQASREVLKHKQLHAKRPCKCICQSLSPSALVSLPPTSATSPTLPPLSPTLLSQSSTSVSPPILSPSSVHLGVQSSRDCSEASSSFIQSEEESSSVSTPALWQSLSEVQVTVDVALSAQILMLKSQVAKLRAELNEAKRAPF